MYNSQLRTYIVSSSSSLQESLKEILKESSLSILLGPQKKEVSQDQIFPIEEEDTSFLKELEALKEAGYEITDSLRENLKANCSKAKPVERKQENSTLAIPGKDGEILAYLNYRTQPGKAEKRIKEKKIQTECFCVKPKMSLLTEAQKASGDTGIVDILPPDGKTWKIIFVDFNNTPRVAQLKGPDMKTQCSALFDWETYGTPRIKPSWTDNCKNCPKNPKNGDKTCKLARLNIVFIEGIIGGKLSLMGPLVWETSGTIDYRLFHGKAKENPTPGPCFQTGSSRGLYNKVLRVEALQMEIDGLKKMRTLLPLDCTPTFGEEIVPKMKNIFGAFYRNVEKQYAPHQVTTPQEHSQEEYLEDIPS